MPRISYLPFALLITLGCGSEDQQTTPSTTSSTTTDGTTVTVTVPTPSTVTKATVNLTTQDGVNLVADHYPAAPEAPAVLLLHMIPPGAQRSDWPESFISKLSAEGWRVLNVDRRGAGDSDGVPEDAYDGPKGKWDAKAGVDFLAAAGAPRIAILGASNGSTTTLDYTVWAQANGHTEPAMIGFLTGGGYTESQKSVEQVSPATPVYFAFSTAEKAWSEAQREHDPGSWVFAEYADGAHGTNMFAAVPSYEDDLVAELRNHLVD